MDDGVLDEGDALQAYRAAGAVDALGIGQRDVGGNGGEVVGRRWRRAGDQPIGDAFLAGPDLDRHRQRQSR